LGFCKLCGRDISSSHHRIVKDFKAVRLPSSDGIKMSLGQEMISRDVRNVFPARKLPEIE
jgi:hypothetical protein